MTWITDLLNYISKIFQWWVIVLPWEQGIRVRRGKTKKILLPGVYARFPIIDKVFVQTVRKRFVSMPMQTLTTTDCVTLSVVANIGFCIIDVNKFYDNIYHAESALCSIGSSVIAQIISSHHSKSITPAVIESAAADEFSATDFGIGNVEFKIVGFAMVRTHRLLMDQAWFPKDTHDEQYKDR